MTFERPTCTCNDAWKQRGCAVKLHRESQDENSDGWKRLLDLIEEVKQKNNEEFKPGSLLSPEDWHSIVTLPPQIGTLKSVRRLCLYGSSLVRIPPEIGDMTALEEFDPYTSYRLHWFPFEITRCANLRNSRISTRALYGNFKYRNPFPDLRKDREFLDLIRPTNCSVCRVTIDNSAMSRWISLKIATDVIPLLVFACSEKCIDSLPIPADNHVPISHLGGRSIEQPPRR